MLSVTAATRTHVARMACSNRDTRMLPLVHSIAPESHQSYVNSLQQTAVSLLGPCRLFPPFFCLHTARHLSCLIFSVSHPRSELFSFSSKLFPFTSLRLL